MTNVAIIGAQWGDEGKGKIVDLLSNLSDVVVRFQGGHNAGHTLVINGNTYKLSLLPSGLVRKKRSIIGSGVVVDPWALIDEIARLRKQGVEINKQLLLLSSTAHLIMPYHRDLEIAREGQSDNISIGSTKRGIGPAYEDKVGRRGIRVCDLLHEKSLQKQLRIAFLHHAPIRKYLNLPELDFLGLCNKIKRLSPKIIPFIGSSWEELDQLSKKGKKILFEGAQGIMLDIDHGTYPYVTSSNTVAGQASIGSGIGPYNVGYVLGITKAYTTRVGEGPFPTEQKNKIGENLADVGHEYGVVTGRKRRCGWFDAALVYQATRISGINGLALTKLDVLDNFEEIKICTSYKIKGKNYKILPPSPFLQTEAIPNYESIKGWKKTTKGIRKWSELPEEAKNYIRRIEALVEIPVALISTSPEREDTIVITNPFK